MGTIHLVRHGQASAHAVGDDFLETDYDKLTPVGVAQARIVGSKLAHILRPHEKVALRSGPLSRQLDTAHSIAAELSQIRCSNSRSSAHEHGTETEITLPCHIDVGWSEYPLEILKPQFKTFRERKEPVDAISSALKQWTASGDRAFEVFTDAVLNSFRAAIAESDRESRFIIATSGGPIGLCTAYSLGLPLENWVDLTTRIPNGSITTFHARNGQAILSTFNDYSHLQNRRSSGTAPQPTYL